MHTTASSDRAIFLIFLYGNQQKFNIEAVNDNPPIRFEIRFERKFPIRRSLRTKKERIVLREIHLRPTRRHLSNGITQCYLLPDRGGRPAFTPTEQVGTRFIDPIRMKG